jgi:hypothetical protein
MTGAAQRHPEYIDADAPRAFAAVGDGYVMTIAALGLEFEIDRLRRARHELVGELTVQCSLAGARTFNGVLAVGDLNLSNIRARQDRAHYLRERAKANDIDWTGLLEEFAQRVFIAERTGQPAVSLRDVPKPQADSSRSVKGFPVLLRHPMCLFGDGGTAKSYLGLFIAGELQQQGLRVGIFDWELAGDDHRERLEALYGADMPDVKYLRCDRPLVHMAEHIRRVVREERLDYAILDSVAFACDGPPEAADVAGRYFQAVRQLGPIGTLHIAHVAKAKDQGDRSTEQRPFGSAFWHNGSRSTWFVKLAETNPASRSISIGLFNRKANLGRLTAPLGFTITFDEGQTTFKRSNLADTPELAARLSIAQRIRHALRATTMTREALADELDDIAPDTLKRTINREIKKGWLVEFPGPGGEKRLGNRTPEDR